MTGSDIVDTIFGALIGAVLAWAGKLTAMIRGNRDDVLIQRGLIQALEARVEKMDQEKITTEGVREVMSEELEKRDARAKDRREEYDKRLLLTIKSVVQEEQKELLKELDKRTRKFQKE